MRNAIGVLVISLAAAAAHAAELSEAALQGSWTIVEFQGGPDLDGDKWEFEKDRFYQNLSGHRMSPDRYRVSGSYIDLGYYKIKVKSFDGRQMTAVMAGFDYKLRKDE